MFWTLCIAIFLYRQVFRAPRVYHINDQQTERYILSYSFTLFHLNSKNAFRTDNIMMGVFHVVSWGEPLAFVIVCYSLKLFAVSSNGSRLCYPASFLAHFWFWFVPVAVSSLIRCFAYFIT